MKEEGLLDRAAREKRERDAKAEAVLNGLKLQRALLATLVIVAGGAAAYFHAKGEASRKAAAVVMNDTAVELRKAKDRADRSDKDLAEARSRNDGKLAALEAARREESAALNAKVTALESQISADRDEKVALRAKIDALQANATPQVTVVNTTSAPGAAKALAKPEIAAKRLESDREAVAKLAGWLPSMSRYSVANGPGRQLGFAANAFRKWCIDNQATIKARAEAKGWMDKPEVISTIKAWNNPEAIDRRTIEYVDDLKRRREDTGSGIVGDNPARKRAKEVAQELKAPAEKAYAELQVVGAIMSDATEIGRIKKCNE